MRPRLSRIIVKVIAKLPADLDAIARGRLQKLPKHRLRPPIAICIAVVEESNPLILGKLHQPDASFVGVMPPPIHAKNPAAKRDGRNFDARVSKLPSFHDRYLLQKPTSLSLRERAGVRACP